MSITSIREAGALLGLASDASAAERTSDARAAEWAELLAQCLTTQVPPTWRELPSPAAWQGSDNRMARSAQSGPAQQASLQASEPAAGAAVAGASGVGTSATDAPEHARLALTVDAGQLGELSLTVDRTSAGLRVVIGVQDTQALPTLGVERAALERALSALGLTLESVNVVAQANVGTVLAQPSKGRSFDPVRQQASARSQHPEQKRSQRRLNLVG